MTSEFETYGSETNRGRIQKGLEKFKKKSFLKILVGNIQGDLQPVQLEEKPVEAPKEEEQTVAVPADEVLDAPTPPKKLSTPVKKPSPRILPKSPPNELETISLKSHKFEKLPQLEAVSLLQQHFLKRPFPIQNVFTFETG